MPLDAVWSSGRSVLNRFLGETVRIYTSDIAYLERTAQVRRDPVRQSDGEDGVAIEDAATVTIDAVDLSGSDADPSAGVGIRVDIKVRKGSATWTPHVVAERSDHSSGRISLRLEMMTDEQKISHGVSR